jgi:hypothetical protein
MEFVKRADKGRFIRRRFVTEEIYRLEEIIESAIGEPGKRASLEVIAEWAAQHPELMEHEVRLRSMLNIEARAVRQPRRSARLMQNRVIERI